MTAPTVDTPLTADIERVDAFIDKRCTGGTSECPCPHGSWDRITAALLAARREVEALRTALLPKLTAILANRIADLGACTTVPDGCSECLARECLAALAATPEEKK